MNEPLSPGDTLFGVPFVFRNRGSTLPADLRPGRRICLLLLILERCWGNKATLAQLHVMDWACRTPESRRLFITCLERGRGPDLPCVRYDPSLNRAIDWASGYGYVGTTMGHTGGHDALSAGMSEYRVWLTSLGKQVVEALDRIPDCLVAERELLSSVKGKIRQDFVRPFLRWELTS